MNILSGEKVKFKESINLITSPQEGTFIEFSTSDTFGVYAIILKSDGKIAIIPVHDIEFIGDFS